ncbi:MAG TPA: CheR family methyltransferase, partial [Flavisolibacter sp.]|nr:CheR family methyltransferase [Flavisolibacter sp.]
KDFNESFINDNDHHLKMVLSLLLHSSSVDFTQYKMSTIKRRIIRRLLIHKMESLKEYSSFLKSHPIEINHLFDDLLINVTSFFRDDDQFEYIKKHIIPKIIQGKGKNEQIRVWVPACSTGQEAYSLAILFAEVFGDNYSNLPIQIFATDLSEIAITKARLGIYSAEEVANLPPKRLQMFFTKIDGSYRIIKNIRDLCIFATHNIAKDPPFSSLDLISCCNLLIYLDNQLQKKVLGIFHYSINNSGVLVLGKSESVGSSAYLFSQLDKSYKIFSKKKDVSVRAAFEINYKPSYSIKPGVTDMKTGFKNQKTDDSELDKTIERLILQKYMPASVVVNGDLDILQFRGSTGNFLEPLPGKASLNLMKMARPGLGFELRNIVHKSKKTLQPVKKKDILITVEGNNHKVTIEAIPIKEDPEQEYYLILFTEEDNISEENKKTSLKDSRVKQLELELAALREDMRAIVESQEAANEELQSANEEIVSSNEELQSINEELETSKEEIESSNEELMTINQELQIRNEQLLESNEYALSVFTTMRESLLILDNNYRVKSANAAFFQTFQCKEEDTIGAIIFELNNGQWNIEKFRELLDKVLPDNSQHNGYELIHDFKIVGKKRLLINAKRITQKIYRQHLILLAIEDVTE